MNREKQLEFKNFIQNKKVAVVGLGRSNLPLIHFLLDYPCQITGFDKASREKLPEGLCELEQKGVSFSLGQNYLDTLEDFDILFRTPGMRPDHPAFVRAIQKGAVITSEMEVFFDLCPGKIFGITGSDGKTTTTTLIYEMLKAEGYSCFLGGNIGRPLISDLEQMDPEDMIVVELSSFQLMTMNKSPQIAVITNITPNHLDVHLSMEEYVAAKKNIFIHQKDTEDILILNHDNPITKGFVQDSEAKTILFSRQIALSEGFYLEKGDIVQGKGNGDLNDFMSTQDILLRGVHNIENYMAAMAAVSTFVKKETIQKIAKTFKGVEHRLEWVREYKGIQIYNDSIASSPTRTIAGLRSFPQRVVLMAGGCDKKLDYTEFGYILLDTVKELVLVGQTGPKIARAFEAAKKSSGKGKDIGVHLMNTFEEAVQKAVSVAAPGDVVMMSPASTSFDRFKNFEERGKYFKDIVMAME